MSFKHLFSCVAVMTLLFAVGCEDKAGDVDNQKPNDTTDTPEEPEAATFSLAETELEYPADGGEATVAYTITNPVKGGVVLTDCAESWIKELSTATYGSITFTVAPNYTDKVREAVISVTYTGVEDKFSIKVTQEASDDPVFSVKVVHNAPRTLLMDVTPADKETAYLCGIYSEDYIDAFRLTTDVALHAKHIEALGYEASRNGQSLQNYLTNISHVGDAVDVEFTDLNPDTPYVVFCYHVDLSTAQLIGDIYREDVRTAKPEQVDVELQMSLTVNNNAISQTITSSNEEVYYYTGYWKVNDFYSYFGGDAKMEEVFPARWNETVITQQSYGKSLTQVIEEFCKKGSQTIDNTGLANYTEYVFFLFAVDPETGFAASETILAKATTTSAVDSGVTIEITVENLMATTADVYWKASSKGATFERSCFTKSEFEALGDSDEVRFERIRKDYGTLFVATGATDMNLYNLTPNTTYVAFAFGVDGETPNTRIFTKEFTTLSNVAGKSNISIAWNEHYNAAEVAALDAEHWGDYASYSNHAIVPTTISGTTSGDNVYIMLSSYSIDYYGTDNAQWLRDLVSNAANKVNCYTNYTFVAEYEREYVLVAVAQDADGNYGQLIKQEVCLYASDAAAAESYVYVDNK